MASGFELPFQWDDGTFVSPFVRSSGDTLQEVGQFIGQFLERRISSEAAVQPIEIVVTDLGCGDGHALFELCPVIAAHLGRICTAEKNISIRARGVDLDEELIGVANARQPPEEQRQTKTSETSSCVVPVRYHFEVADICDMRPDDVASPCAHNNGGGGGVTTTIHVVFVFLLTTALEQLKSLVLSLLPRVEFFISNSWSVPYLQESQHFVGKMGSCFVYRQDSHTPA